MPDDRERLFEKALARHLQSERGDAAWCLDTETLAAYHERMLPGEEMTAAKTHIASCPRCQEILAQLEVTQEMTNLHEEPANEPAGVAGSASFAEKVFEGAQALPHPRASRPETVSGKTVIAIPSKSRRSLVWAIPAGAIAASLLLWMGIQQTGKYKMTAPESAQVAENRSAPAATDKSAQALQAVPVDQAPSLLEKQKKLEQAEPLAPAKPNLRDSKKDSGTDKSVRTAPPELKTRQYAPSSRFAQAAPGPSAARSQAQAADSIERSDSGVVGQMTVEVAPAAPALDAAPVPAPAAKVGAGTGGGRGITGGALASAKSAPAPPPPAPTPEAQAEMVARNQAVDGRDYANFAPVLSKTGMDIRIAAPGGKKIWSVGPNGQILFSKDGGKLWVMQLSGVSANLTSGSAPSDKVCWLAGAAGTVLRTTDGGKAWQSLRTPISGDLGGVHAADAKHASIWDASRRTSYETSDGGETWKPTSNE